MKISETGMEYGTRSKPKKTGTSAKPTPKTISPPQTVAKRLIRLPGIDGVQMVQANMSVFPPDQYVEKPACVMDLTDEDKGKGMP